MLIGLECLHAAVGDISEGSSQLSIDRVVKLCYIVLDLLLHNRSLLTDRRFLRKWRGVLRFLTRMLRDTPPASYEPAKEQKTWIDLWLRRIHQMDTGERYYKNGHDKVLYAAWRDTFKPEESPVSDALITALMKLFPILGESTYQHTLFMSMDIPTMYEKTYTARLYMTAFLAPNEQSRLPQSIVWTRPRVGTRFEVRPVYIEACVFRMDHLISCPRHLVLNSKSAVDRLL